MIKIPCICLLKRKKIKKKNKKKDKQHETLFETEKKIENINIQTKAIENGTKWN